MQANENDRTERLPVVGGFLYRVMVAGTDQDQAVAVVFVPHV